jgi:hypothetical protein
VQLAAAGRGTVRADALALPGAGKFAVAAQQRHVLVDHFVIVDEDLDAGAVDQLAADLQLAIGADVMTFGSRREHGAAGQQHGHPSHNCEFL